MIYLNIVVVKSSVVSGEERYGGYVRKGIGTMELEVDEMLVAVSYTHLTLPTKLEV